MAKSGFRFRMTGLKKISRNLQRLQREGARAAAEEPCLWYTGRVKVRALIRLLKDDGWVQVTTQGSHRHFKHPSKPGRVTVSGALGDDMPKGTLASVLRQSGLKRGKK